MKLVFSLVFAFVLLAGNAFGAIIQTNASLVSDTSADQINLGPALSNDLINAGQATLLSSSHSGAAPLFVGFGLTTDALNNGTLGAPGLAAPPDPFIDSDGTWVSTFTLDTSANTLGYDITEIITHAGGRTDDNGTDGRVFQRYTLEYNTVSNASFVSLGEFSFGPNVPLNFDASSRITLTDTTGTVASGVKELRFTVLLNGPTASGYATMYREFDVVGQPTVVPEPTGFALGAIGCLGLAGCGWRRRFR